MKRQTFLSRDVDFIEDCTKILGEDIEKKSLVKNHYLFIVYLK